MALDAVLVILRRDLKRYFRQRSQLAGAIARPLLWLFILGFGMRSMIPRFDGLDYVQFVFPGVVCMTLLFTAVFSAISIIWDREFGFLKGVLVAPIPRSMVIIGKTLSGTVIALIQGTIVVAFAPLAGVKLGLLPIIGALALMVLIAFSMTALGLAIASRMTSFEGFSTLMNFIIMPVFFLSGAMFDITRVPEWLRMFVWVNPLSYGVDALRSQMLGIAPAYPLILSVSVLIVFSAAMVMVTAKLFAKTA